MPNPTPEIRADRVTIRRTTEADLPDLMTLWNDGRVMKWVGFPDGLGYDEPEIDNWLKRLRASPHCHHFVIHSKNARFCGELFYEVGELHQRAGLDIKLVPEMQGQGIATEALKRFIDFIFETEPEVEAVWTEPSAENSWGEAFAIPETLVGHHLAANASPRIRGRPIWLRAFHIGNVGGKSDMTGQPLLANAFSACPPAQRPCLDRNPAAVMAKHLPHQRPRLDQKLTANALPRLSSPTSGRECS